jgi:trimeric autotransporter adhesin
MRKFVLPGLLLALLTAGFFVTEKLVNSPSTLSAFVDEDDEEENERYENQEDRFAQLFEQMKDPKLGYIPKERLAAALEQTKMLRSAPTARAQAINWQERGPIYDFVGTSNGNSRGGGTPYTAGIIQTSLLDTINDPTGNSIFSGTPSGGLWKCTNLLSTDAPNWQPVNDFMSNLAVASICRNPLSPNIMYIATGDGNTREVRGNGVWKSTDNGATWNLLASSSAYNYAFKIICDAAGNVYLATAGSGLLRSKDGGATWFNISPSGIVATNPTYVPDIEISSNGRLHATFGYYGTAAKHYYTDVPAFASSAIGWQSSTGIRLSTVGCSRIELASQGDVAYAVTVNTSMNMDSCYKSTDDGATWTKTTVNAYDPSLGSGQGWYAITLSINPDDANSFIVGGLDAYRSTNSGATISKITNWVNFAPYVHADHHWMGWYKAGTESRIMIGCDGGMFVSRDGGSTWKDRNENMGIKQFYSCAIEPTAGSNVLLAGAQDNGCHLIKTPGKTYSTEVTGGDGAYVHINQTNSQIMFGSYIYNVYRRSTNGGLTWSSNTLSNTSGYFINPFDYDDAQNILYSSDANSNTPNNQIRRWADATTAGSASSVTVVLSQLGKSATSKANASTFKVSPFSANTLFIGGSTGKLLKVSNANTVTAASSATDVTDLSYFGFPTGYVNCINTGTNEQNLVITYSNYGVNNIWVSTNGGTNWVTVDGNLPDMPVWFATFEPGSNSRMIIGTETGVFTTDLLDGANTVWTPNPGFPMVRTTMLKVRAADRTIVASTYGRGLWTATIPDALPVKLTAFDGQLQGSAALLKWSTSSEQNSASFDIEKSTDMVHFSKIGSVTAAGTSNIRRDYTFRDQALSENNYYRLRSVDKDGKHTTSQVVLVRFNAPKQNIWVITNPFKDRVDIRVAREVKKGKLQLVNLQGSIIAEKAISNVTGQISFPLNNNVSAGTYILRTIADGEVFTNKLVKN